MKKLKNLYNTVTLAKNGVKIGIIGYLTPDTRFLATKNKVEYEDEITAIRREVVNLKKQGVEILIALGHSGFTDDVKIAKEVQDLDLVVGGHSNTFLWNGNSTEKPEQREGPYPVVVNQASGRKVLVVQAYAYTKYIGQLHVTFDSEGEVLQYDGSPILLDNNIPNDQELLDLVDTYKDDVNRVSDEVVGVSTVFLNGECRLRECNIGNFVTDTLLNYTKRYFPEQYRDVNIAICQSGRIRTSIARPHKPFNLTKGDWINVIPFSDTISIVTMNGSVLRWALEHSVAKWRPIDSVGQFLQFSGMKVVYDLLKPPGLRIVKASAVCSGCESQLSNIEDNYQYTVAMPNFIASGGDDYSIFTELPQEILPYNELTCIYDYLDKYKVISPELTGRITLLNENEAVKILLPFPDANNIDKLPSYSPTFHSSTYATTIAILFSCTLF